MNDFFVLLMMMLVFFLPYFFIFTIIKMSTGALGKIQGGLDSLGNKAKGTGYFGIKDRQKEKKESSAWAMNKANRKAQRTKADATKQAGIVAGTSGSRIARRGAKFGLNEEQARIAAANAQQQLHKIEEEEKQAMTVLVQEELREQTHNNNWDWDRQNIWLRDQANSGDAVRRRAAMSIIASEDRSGALTGIDGAMLRDGELHDAAFQSYVYNKRRDLSNGGASITDPATGAVLGNPVRNLGVPDLLTQSGDFWDAHVHADFDSATLDALYNSKEFTTLKPQAKRIIEASLRARGATYNSSGGAADTAQQAAQAASTSPPPKVAPPSATYTTPDGKWYTNDSNPLVTDPTTGQQVPNPQAKWKKTN